MRWGWTPVAAAVIIAVAAAAAAAAGFDLSGPDGNGGQPEISGLVVGVASGGEEEPTAALPLDRISGKVKLVNAWAPSSGTLTRFLSNGKFGCSAFGSVPGVGLDTDSGGDESRWVAEAVTTPGARDFMWLRSACDAGGSKALARLIRKLHQADQPLGGRVRRADS
ncbi:hypothetical protein MMPV_003730 [Pyropia vietnamensis]